MYVFEHWESPVAKRQKIVSLIQTAKFPEAQKVDFSTYNAQYGSFSDRPGDPHAGRKEESFKSSVRVFIKEDLAIDPKYNSEKFDFNELGQAIENALLFEEYHGNKQIRD